MTGLEIWPKPDPAPTRRLRRRWWARIRAAVLGYFWIPCPLCGQMFAGFESSGMSIPTSEPGRFRIVCPAHAPTWPEELDQ